MMTNLLLTFPRLESIRLTIGPLWTPEHLEELMGLLPPAQAAVAHSLGVMDRVMFQGLACKETIERIELRWNPYVTERSYYTFLRGAYYDTTALSLAAWPAGVAPKLSKLAFCQDLPPNHGVVLKETPVVAGMRALDISDVERDRQPLRDSNGKMDFAQPIIFFNLSCLTTLLNAPIAPQLTHLTLRLPRRHLLLYLCVNLGTLKFLDLSTSHLSTNLALPTLLRHLYGLEALIIDRCTGLFSKGNEDEPQTYDTIEWLGKACGGTGTLRADEALREWRKELRDRRPPDDDQHGGTNNTVSNQQAPRARRAKAGRNAFSAPRSMLANQTASSSSNQSTATVFRPPPIVRDIIILPAVPSLRTIGFGHDISYETNEQWQASFKRGYEHSIDRTIEKLDDALSRWILWQRMSSKQNARLLAFASSVPSTYETLVEDQDASFDEWTKAHDLVRVDVDVVPVLKAALVEKLETFVACFVPDCSNAPGVPHLALSTLGGESIEERNERERAYWKQEDELRQTWEQNMDHDAQCPHLERRRVWPNQM